MIRKPTERDFREGTAVTVLRETGRTAVEARKGVGGGLRGIARLWLYGVFWFGALATALPNMVAGQVWQSLLFLGVLYGAQQLIRAGFKKSLPFLSRGQPLAPELTQPGEIVAAARERLPAAAPAAGRRQSGEFKLSIPISMRQAMTLAIPGVLLLFLSPALGIFSLVPGIALIATAALILLKTLSDRDLLWFDHRSIKVNTLLGEGTLDWAHVDAVEAKVFALFNIKALVMLGTRRAITVTGRNAEGKLIRLRIPIDLLDLDNDGLTALVADLLCCQAAAGEAVPAWQPQAQAAPQYAPTPTSDPRESFDPDAIMARYLAERSQLVVEARPDLSALPQRPTFGRKTA